jgi:hypothetical protein
VGADETEGLSLGMVDDFSDGVEEGFKLDDGLSDGWRLG